jgi:hypothetical protein
MSKLRNKTTGDVISTSQFKGLYPNTSFPKPMTVEVYESFGYDSVLNGAAATVTAPYEVSQESGIEEVDGKWFTKFIVGPIFTDTKDDDGNTVTAATNEAAYKAKVDAAAAASVRSQRDTKLSDCDWTQTNDSPVKDESTWTTYRQALRDVPTQSGFPHTVTWPTKPT